MWFLNRIIDHILDIALFFLDLSHEIRDWGNWARWAADFTLDIADAFAHLAYPFRKFNDWVEYVDGLVGDTFSISQIIQALKIWLDYATWAWNWVSNAWANVKAIIEEWWGITLPTVFGWIISFYNWSIDAVNDARDSILAIIADVKTWTITEINNAVENITQVVTNIYDYSQTIINNITEYVTQFVTNIYNYSQTIINNITEFVTQVVTNIYDYSVTTLNNITQVITEVLDWDRVTKFLNDWWSDRLLNIQTLFYSWTLELEPFWAGWQDIRGKVFDFFDDPLEWLLNRFTDWFLGPEV